MGRQVTGWLGTWQTHRRVRAAILLLAVLGVVNVGSHLFDWLVWTFEPDFVVNGVGSHQPSSELLIAGGEYFLALDVIGARPPATFNQGGETLAKCLVDISLHSQQGNVPFLSNPHEVQLINGTSDGTLENVMVVPGTGWYNFYVVADDGCEWQLKVSKL